MSKKEIFVGSISAQPELIPLAHVLEKGLIPRNAEELQIIFEKPNLTQENFSKILRLVFKVEVKPEKIPFNTSSVDLKDQFFAYQFGYVLTPLAFGRLVENKIVAWIEPTLVRKDHPLASSKAKNSIRFVYGSMVPQKRSAHSLIPREKIISAHYVRFTVEDEPLVLHQLASEIAEQEINICEVRQPEVKKTDKLAEVAFLLDPCETELVDSAVSSIKELSTCSAVSAIFRVVGYPTRDLSRKDSKSYL